MNAKKERELLVVGLEKLLLSESNVVEDYRALAELIEGAPASLLLDWIVVEAEAHYTLLINILHSLRRNQNTSQDDAKGIVSERQSMLCWIKRLQTKEQKAIALCQSLKSQACWAPGTIVDTFLDACIMDCEKHHRILRSVEEAVDHIIMSRPQ
jgi:rubrerythrin